MSKRIKTVKKQDAPMPQSVSLSDVAKHAGVSTATVSRALNSPEKVAEKKRLLVEEAITKLGYIPDGAARALASRRTKTIGAVVPTLDNAIFATGIQALQSRLKSVGYTLIVASHEYNLDEELHEVKTLLHQGVEGIMLVGGTHKPELDQLLQRKNISHVNCWAYEAESLKPYVGFDNKNAAKRLTDYLLTLGHKDFAVIIGHTENNDRAEDRLTGIKEAIGARGLILDEKNILQRAYSVKQGREAMQTLLKAHSLKSKNRPTAVICGNDILALGALAECQAAGIDVPTQISITGFDDLELSSQFVPPLTTVRIPSAEMGRLAADYLIAQINGEETSLHTEVAIELVLRDTTAAPPA